MMTARDKAGVILKAAIAAVQPASLLPAHLYVAGNWLYIMKQRFLLSELPNIYIVGAGKASAAMAASVEKVLGELITAGIIVTKHHHALPLQFIRCMEAAHPVPDEHGVVATQATIDLLQQAGANDIVICLVSGGASALWIDVPEGAVLQEVQETVDLLLKSGANIGEMNLTRTQLSRVKGGRLLQHAPLARWFSFIISDVPGDHPAVIGSGPTVPANSNFREAMEVIGKYELSSRLPASILQYLSGGCQSELERQPPPGTAATVSILNNIIGNNSLAISAAAACATGMGFTLAGVEQHLSGDAALTGRNIIQTGSGYRGIKPACFLFGGETTVQVTSKGKGGRNQHLALSALVQLTLADTRNSRITLLAAGTDGTDGPTDAAGAFADHICLDRAQQENLDPGQFLEAQDAYHFFEKTGALLKTGPTQTNVMDLVVMLVE